MRTHSQKNAIAHAMAATLELAQKGRLSHEDAELTVRQLLRVWQAATSRKEDLPPIIWPVSSGLQENYAPTSARDIMAHYRAWQDERTREEKGQR